MLKLKRILIEGLEKIDVEPGEVPADVAFTLSETDPWEYMVKSKDKTIYTRKKGEKHWKPMKEVAANFNLAMQRITSMDKFLTGSSNKNEIGPEKEDKIEPEKEDKIKPKIDKYLAADYKIQTNIVAELFDMITKNPAKYFGKFKSFINDDEQGAAAFFKKKQTEFEDRLDNIKNKNNEDIKLNTKLIKNIMDNVYKSIKNNSPIKKSIQLTDPTYKASSSNETKYRTYSALIWWQYFKN